MHRSKIAIVHPLLIEGGGSESRALWIAEALTKDFDIHLVSMGGVNLERLNEYYGSNLSRSEVEIIEIAIPGVFKKCFDALRGYRLARFCKKRSSEFDLIISAYDVMDFGRKGIQFIADFSFDDRLRRTFHPAPQGVKGIFYQKSPLRWMYLKLGESLAGISKDGWKRNITIANSAWTRKIMKEVYGIETRTIYPPVVGKFPDIPWDKRENGFVCIGRLVPEKGIDIIIDILKKVGKTGQDTHLHIFGGIDNSPYISSLQRLCDENREWAFMEGKIFAAKKQEIIAQHKFGISNCKNESFGIAIAEMVKAGCIVWVPNGGGQVEIVNHPMLIYDTVEDAADKIVKVLKSTTLQAELREHLAQQSKKFSTERFTIEIRELVTQFLQEDSIAHS